MSSEPSRIQQEQEAPMMREPATGPLLPRWFMVAFYLVFGAFVLFSFWYIGRSIYHQHMLTSAVHMVEGGVDEGLVDLSTAGAQDTMEWLDRYRVDAFQYLNQELLREEEDDRRMARALALRKALQWGKTSRRRETVEEIVANMTEEGELEDGYSIAEDDRRVLEAMVEDREAAAGEMSYAENRITDVLRWLVDPEREPARGPEKRRMRSLELQYAKEQFLGAEQRALRTLAQEWAADEDAAAREAAERFEQMLAGQTTELSEAGAELCRERADYWEEQYRVGMTRIARRSYRALRLIVEQGRFVDHPHIFQFVSMLGHRFDSVREQIIEGVWLYRHNKFTIRFLREFATKTAINPVMAVETVRLTKEEHERLMRRKNTRRLREAVRLLGRVGVDFVEHPAAYAGIDADPTDYIRAFVLHPLSDLTDEPIVSDLAEEALDLVRRADEARPEGPLFFRPGAELAL